MSSGETLQEPGQLVGVDGHLGGNLGGEFTDQFGGTPRRLALRQRYECPVDHRRRRLGVDADPVSLPTRHAGD